MVKRNVFFYEIRPTRQMDADWRLDVPDLMSALDSLPNHEKILRTPGSPEAAYEFVRVMEGDPPAIIYVQCRDHGLPMLAEDVDLYKLEIAAQRHLAEVTHAVFFDGNIAGAEYNHHGPRLSALARYLRFKVPECLPDNRRVRIVPLKDEDTLSVFRQATSVQTLSLRMGPTLASVRNPNRQGMNEILGTMADGYGARKVGIELQNGEGLQVDAAIGLVDWALEGGSNLLTAKAVITDDGGVTRELNLLQSRVGEEREMELLSALARSIDHESAREQIAQAYTSLEDKVVKASTIWGVEPDEDSA